VNSGQKEVLFRGGMDSPNVLWEIGFEYHEKIKFSYLCRKRTLQGSSFTLLRSAGEGGEGGGKRRVLQRNLLCNEDGTQRCHWAM